MSGGAGTPNLREEENCLLGYGNTRLKRVAIETPEDLSYVNMDAKIPINRLMTLIIQSRPLFQVIGFLAAFSSCQKQA